MINIPQNNYKVPTEVRDEAVQGIAEAFLNLCCWSTYHPFSDGCHRPATNCILKHKGCDKYYGFGYKGEFGDDYLQFNGAEMKKAFALLDEAGYYIFKVYEYDTWMGYVVSRKPSVPNWSRAERVYEFTDFID